MPQNSNVGNTELDLLLIEYEILSVFYADGSDQSNADGWAIFYGECVKSKIRGCPSFIFPLDFA